MGAQRTAGTECAVSRACIDVEQGRPVRGVGEQKGSEIELMSARWVLEGGVFVLARAIPEDRPIDNGRGKTVAVEEWVLY